jgi:hypothetical protein
MPITLPLSNTEMIIISSSLFKNFVRLLLSMENGNVTFMDLVTPPQHHRSHLIKIQIELVLHLID